MTAQTNNTIRWTIGILVSLTVLLSFSFALGVGFTKNGAEHIAINENAKFIKSTMASEITRSITTDKITADYISKINTDIGKIQTSMKNIDKTVEKIENKLK